MEIPEKYKDKKLMAQVLNFEGHKQKEIAQTLGVDIRTVRNYLNPAVTPQVRNSGTSKLQPFHHFIDEAIDFDPKCNLQNLFSNLKEIGYTGSITILRDYARKRRRSTSIKSDEYSSILISEKDEFDWMHRVIQGQQNQSDLVSELDSLLNDTEISILYDCILNKQLRYRNRALALLAIYKGISEKTISGFLFISRATIKNIQHTYRTRGIDSIVKDERTIIKKHENPEYIEKVFSILHAPPSSYGFNRTTWKQDDLKEIMTAEGYPIAKDGLSKIISNAGYKYRKAKTVLTSNDPEYKEKLEEIKSILSNLGEKEKFFSIDEYGPFSIKIQGGKSLVAPGTVKTVPQWQKSKGSLIMTAALELSTNQITHFYSKKKNTDEMIKLLNILIEQYSAEDTIYFSWDAASWHASKKLYEAVDEINSDEYRKEKTVPFVKLAPLPTCAQFLNVIESVFSGMARAIIHNSNYKSVKECKAAIDTYFEDRNEHFMKHPKRAGNKIWGKERVQPEFSESNNCKDPMYR